MEIFVQTAFRNKCGISAFAMFFDKIKVKASVFSNSVICLLRQFKVGVKASIFFTIGKIHYKFLTN